MSNGNQYIHCPKISVITPVYNVKQYLGSDLHRFELLLIGNGSLDNSGWICDEYAEKDNRWVMESETFFVITNCCRCCL